MLNPDSQKPSNIEESKENRADISQETETTVDEAKKSEINESNAQVIRVSQNSNLKTGKYRLLDLSVVFDAIRSLYVA